MDQSQYVLIGVVITTVLAPTWLSWWNTRVTKKNLTVNNHGTHTKDVLDNLTGESQRTLARVFHVETRLDRLETSAKNISRQLDTVIQEQRTVRDCLNKREAAEDAKNASE